MDWSSIFVQARSGSLVFWAGFAVVAASLTLVTAAVYVLTRRLIVRWRGAIEHTKAEQRGMHQVATPPDAVRAAAAYGQPATGIDHDIGRPDAVTPDALLARLRGTSARLEQMVAELQLEE